MSYLNAGIIEQSHNPVKICACADEEIIVALWPETGIPITDQINGITQFQKSVHHLPGFPIMGMGPENGVVRIRCERFDNIGYQYMAFDYDVGGQPDKLCVDILFPAGF
jgi:hypothetical protein